MTAPRRAWLPGVGLACAGLGALAIGLLAGFGDGDGGEPVEPTAAVAVRPFQQQATATPTPRLHAYIGMAARDGYPPTATPTPTPTPPTLEGLRFYGGGDSTSYFMNLSLADRFTAGGASFTHVDYGGFGQSSGLANPGFFNWPAQLDYAMDTYTPDVAVFMLGANDAWIGTAGAEAQASYAATVGSTMDLMDDGERLIVWVGQPNMGRADLVARLPRVNEIFAAEAAKRENVIYVDIWAITSDANGNYAASLVNGAGQMVLARAGDGVHFTFAGADILAAEVVRAVLAELAAR